MKFRPHQKKMFEYTLNTQHPALFVDMRLGKTLVTIRRIKMYNKCNSVLIVAPYSAFSGWRETIMQECNSEPIELTESKIDSDTQLIYRFPVNKYFLINHIGFLRVDSLKSMPWDVVIIDESTCLKSYTTQISKYFCKYFRNVKHRWILTGLPDPESELNYFQQLKFLNPNILGWDVRAFKMRYFVQAQFQTFITNKGKRLLSSKIAEHCFFMTRKEAGYSNEKVYKRRTIKMPENIRKIYTKIENEFILETDEYQRMTKYAITKFGWLRELCCGVVYENETDKELIWDGKLQLLEELVDGELKNVPLIIWCNYINDIKNIQKMLNTKILCIGVIYGDVKKSVRDRLVSNFQKGKIDILLIQPTTMRFGANLSYGSTCIYYSTPLGLETRLQTEDRIIDIAKKEQSLIIDLEVEDTIEGQILKNLKRKNSRQENLRNIIKTLQKGRR